MGSLDTFPEAGVSPVADRTSDADPSAVWRLMLEALVFPVLAVGPDGRIAYLNGPARRLIGAGTQVLDRRPMDLLSITDPSSGRRMSLVVQAALEVGAPLDAICRVSALAPGAVPHDARVYVRALRDGEQLLGALLMLAGADGAQSGQRAGLPANPVVAASGESPGRRAVQAAEADAGVGPRPPSRGAPRMSAERSVFVYQHGLPIAVGTLCDATQEGRLAIAIPTSIEIAPGSPVEVGVALEDGGLTRWRRFPARVARGVPGTLTVTASVPGDLRSYLFSVLADGDGA